jgi:glyoxylase-like metal-dependent hydrolase (beta-lactamase superfamily II)
VIWGNPDNWIKAIDFILTLKPASLIPGHGGLMTVADAAQLRDYFLFLRERSAQCHGKGLPVADAVKAVAAELPGRFRSLLLPERLAVNVEACYAAIDKTPAPGDYPAFKRFRLFGKMRKARGNFG